MSRKLIIALAIMLVFSFSGVAFAANPFDDVPEDHWAYGAVTQLVKAGVLQGYDDKSFRGDKPLTRYEMAQVVAKAISKSEKGLGNAETKAIIEKLKAEFANELVNLGVKIKQLDQKIDRVQIHGELRYMWRTQTNQVNTIPGTSTKFQTPSIYGEYAGGDGRPGGETWMQQQIRYRLRTDVKINESWSFYGQVEVQDNMKAQPTTPTVSGQVMDGTPNQQFIYAKGPIAKGVNLSVGKIQFTQGYGFLTDDGIQGMALQFGNKVKANLQYGRLVTPSVLGGFKKAGTSTLVPTIYLNANGTIAANSKINVTSADVSYWTSKSTMLRGGYLGLKGVDLDGKPTNNAWEFSAYHQLSKNWSLLGWYAKSNASDRNKAHLVELFYNAIPNLRTPGSDGAWLMFRTFDEKVGWDPNLNLTKMGNPVSGYDGTRGFETGYYYIPARNTMVKLWYTKVNAIHRANWQQVQTRAQVEFFF